MTEIEIKGEKIVIVPIQHDVDSWACNGTIIFTDSPRGYTKQRANGCMPSSQFGFRYSTATDSDFEKVVGIEFDGDFQDFASMNNNCITAKGSFQTLLRRHSLDPNADYIILKMK